MGRVVRFSLSMIVIAAVLWLSDLGQIGLYLRGANIAWLAMSAACLSVLILLMAWRWQLIARRMDMHMSLGHAIGEYYLSQLVNQTVPGGVTGDAARAVRARDGRSLGVAAQTVIFERVIGQIIFSALMLAGFCLALPSPVGIAWPSQTAWAIGGAVLCALLAAWVSRGYAGRLGSLLVRPEIVGLSIVISGVLVLGFYASARAIGTVLPPEALFTLIPLVLTAMLVPLSIGGWGWREGAAAALFPLAGATSEAGVAAGITYGALMLLTSLPALIWLAICGLRNRPSLTSKI